MQVLIDQFKMETNFEGLIELLAKSLYSEPDVFIRELIQNGNDSIVRRREVDMVTGGRIDIRTDTKNSNVTFLDNGIGMDMNEIKAFLSVIGSSGTGTYKQKIEKEGKQAAYSLIGQFGIGMLSAFVVAEKVVVKTRKLGSLEAFAWHNSGNMDCFVYRDDKQEAGSEIIISIKPDYIFVLDEKRIQKTIIKYCDFINFPIFVNGYGPVNAIEAPWHREHWSSEFEKEASYESFLIRRFSEKPLDIIPIEITEPIRASGALYITDQRLPGIGAGGLMDIFIRRMFIKGDDSNLIPSWAKFIKGVIESPDLQPTASRDNIQKNYPGFELIQKKIGELIIERLIWMAQFKPERFKQINYWHHYHIKCLACLHDDFFEKVFEYLLFDTNKGSKSFREYLSMNDHRLEFGNKFMVYYFVTSSEESQFYTLAEARGWVVIHAGNKFEEELLIKYAKCHSNIQLERLDTSDDPSLFKRLNQLEKEQFRQTEIDMEWYLRRLGISNMIVRTRRFDPPELPALIIITPEKKTESELKAVAHQPWFMECLEDVVKDTIDQMGNKHPIYLTLNAENELIQKLVKIDRTSDIGKEMILGIYNIAVLYSQNSFTQNNAKMIHLQLIRLFNMLLSLDEQIFFTKVPVEFNYSKKQTFH